MTDRKTAEPGRTRKTSSLAVEACWPVERGGKSEGGGMVGGREGERERGREGGRERGREGEREGGREGGRERGREGERKRRMKEHTVLQ